MSSDLADVDEIKTTSQEAFVTALVTNSAVFGASALGFFVVCRWFPKIYEPRTFLPASQEERSQPLAKTPWAFVKQLWSIPAEQVIEQNGLDAYVYLRFLALCFKIFAPFWFLTWILLIPINRADTDGDQTGLYRFSFGNVSPGHTDRHWAHLIVIWLLTFHVCLLLWREMNNFVQLRLQYLTRVQHKKSAQARTVLVMGLANEFRHQRSLRKLADQLPGGTEMIWMSRELGSKMVNLYEERQKLASMLEGALVKLIRTAVKKQRQINRSLDEQKKKRPGASHDALASEMGIPVDAHEEPEQALTRLVATKDRPQHRIDRALGVLPCTGKTVDTVDWASQRLAEVSSQLEAERSSLLQRPVHNSAFILFKRQMAAHIFAQTTSHNRPLLMTDRYVEVHPENVIFNNLAVDPMQAKIRYALSWAGSLGLIISWAFPVAFVGSLSNVNRLCEQASWLRWLCNLPVPINGIIQGLLPAVALALLFMIPPFVFRTLARFEGVPMGSQVELSLMTRFFIFLVLQGFIVVTLSSGLIGSLPIIASNPGSIAGMLATNLPTASNFYLTYFATSGLGGAGGALLQIVTLILYHVFLFLLASTPRKVYTIKFDMEDDSWGTLFPSTTLFTVIGLAYTSIAPLLAGFAMLLFFLFYYIYKYLFVFVWDFPEESESGGLFFPLAVHHVFTGLYIAQVCLAGLFFLVRDVNQEAACVPQGALTVALIVLTVLFHALLVIGYRPLIKNLPLNLGVTVSEDDLENSLSKKKAFTGFKEDPLSAVMDTGMILGGKAAGLAGRQVNRATDLAKATGMKAAVGAGNTAGMAGRQAMGGVKYAGTAMGFKPSRSRPDMLRSRSADTGRSVYVDAADDPVELSMMNTPEASPATTTPDNELEDAEVDEHTFDHPASYEEMPPVWLPADNLGIGEWHVQKLRALGIDSSTSGATMDDDGYVRVSRPPPEEDWDDGEGLPEAPKILGKGPLKRLHLDR